MSSNDLIVTQFEMDELVFVPAGESGPAQWKRKGDLQPGQFSRYAEHQHAEAVAFGADCERQMAWLAEARERPLGDDEQAEVEALWAKMKARNDAIEKREAAIERDLKAGRYVKRRCP